MSWFFGKKKHHKESPPSTPEEGNSGTGQAEDYVMIEEKDVNPLRPGGAAGGLYPSLGGQSFGPTYPPTLTQQNQAGDTQNYLSGIPFKLSKDLDNDFEIERLRIDEITSFIHRINNEMFEYQFEVERSVMNEVQSGLE